MAETRYQGDRTTEHNDKMSGAAEDLVCQVFGQPYQGNTGQADNGYDLISYRRTIDAKWTGSTFGYLHEELKPWEKYCDVYVLVMGDEIEELKVIGWASGKRLWNAPIHRTPNLSKPAHMISWQRVSGMEHLDRHFYNIVCTEAADETYGLGR